MNCFVRLLIGFALLSFRLPVEAAPTAGAADAMSKFAISAPPPEYPYEARLSRITGSGVIEIDIDPKSGLVTKAVMAKSTGSFLLDNAATSAFRRWRFKPGWSVRKVKTPIAFTITEGRSASFDPNRSYPYSGTVKAVNPQAGTMTVEGPRGTDIIAITPNTRLSKNGISVTLPALAVGDRVRGQAKVTPDRRAVATSAIIKSSLR